MDWDNAYYFRKQISEKKILQIWTEKSKMNVLQNLRTTHAQSEANICLVSEQVTLISYNNIFTDGEGCRLLHTLIYSSYI
jgi:hypothetical protein